MLFSTGRVLQWKCRCIRVKNIVTRVLEGTFLIARATPSKFQCSGEIDVVEGVTLLKKVGARAAS